MKRLMRVVVGLLVSAVLMAWAFRGVDLRDVLQVVRKIDWRWAGLAFGVAMASTLVHCWRWHVLAQAVGGRGNYRQSLAVHFSGLLCNKLIPAQLGLDALRIRYGASTAGKGSQMLAVVAADRLAGALSISVLACLSAGCLLVWEIHSWFLAVPPLMMGGVLAAGIALRSFTRIEDETEEVQRSWTENVRGRLARAFHLFSEQPGLLPNTVGLAVVQTALLALSLGILARALHLPISPLVLAIIFPLHAAVMMVMPFTIGGWGMREALFCLLMIPLGLSQSQALGFAFAWFLLHLCETVPGFVAAVWLSLQWNRETRIRSPDDSRAKFARSVSEEPATSAPPR